MQLFKWILLAIISFLCVTVAFAEEFYVAPSGCDGNPGTKEKPFSTMNAARDAIRKLKSDGKLDAPVTVHVRGGNYVLAEPIMLEAQDSGTKNAPIVYRAYQQEKPVLIGGLEVNGFERHKGEILKAKVPGCKDRKLNSRLLLFDGKRQQMARWPNRNPNDMNGGEWVYVDGKRIDMYIDSPDEDDYIKNHQHLDYWQRNIPRKTRELQMKPEDKRSWSDPVGGEVSIFPRFAWWHYVLKIESFDPEKRLLKLEPGCFYEIRAGDRYFIRGVLEELDQPGEWFFDREEQIVYFWPRSSMQGKSVYVSTLKNIVTMNRCSYVTFQGFTMEACEDDVIDMNDCKNCTIAASKICNAGDRDGCGIVLRGKSQNNSILGNDIYNIGSYGILHDAGEDAPLTLNGLESSVIENNYIHHVGLVDRKGKAIELKGIKHKVRHNLIHDIPQSAIYVWGAMHTIEYNRMHHTCLEGEDTGAIGGGAIDWLGWQATAVRYNIILDTIGYGFDQNTGKWCSPHFVWALYPDWAASGAQIVGNIIARAPRGCLHLHSGCDNLIENNIFVDGGDDQVRLMGWTTNTGYWSTKIDEWIIQYEKAIKDEQWQKIETFKDPRKVPLPDGRVMYGNECKRNIFYYRDPGSALVGFHEIPLDRNKSDYNLIYHFGLPIRTGHFVIKKELGDNMIEDPGLEESVAGEAALKWVKPSGSLKGADIRVDNQCVRSGSNSLKVAVGKRKEGETAVQEVYLLFGTYPFEPGASYRLRAWLKGDGEVKGVQVCAFSWDADTTHYWEKRESVLLNNDWQQYEQVFRLPAKGEKEYVSSMKTFSCRLLVPVGTGKFWVDDVSLYKVEIADEWQSWQAKGQDRHSVIADPLFVNPEKDDYRLKKDSPAFKLGFKPIPVDKIGPYKDSLRATWPIVEAAGAREMKPKCKH